MQKSNIYKKCLIASNILNTIGFILVLIFKTKFTYSLYWISVPLILLFTVLLINEIDKGKVNKDVEKSSWIKRVYNDATALLISIYGGIYLFVEFTEIFNGDIKRNIYAAIGLYIASIIYELFLYIAVDNANKETSKLLKNKK